MIPLRKPPTSSAARVAVALLMLALATGAAAPLSARAGWIGTDLHAMGSRRTATVLASAAALGAASLLIENARTEERALGSGILDGPSDVGNVYGAGTVLAGVAAGFTGAGLLERNRAWLGTGSDLARSLAYTGVVVTALKVTVHRTRPNGGPYSFPSGHTAAAFAVAPILVQRFGTVAAIPAYALAVSTAMGRMEDRKHYLSDVVVGAGIGSAVGLAIAAVRRHREHADQDSASDTSDAPPSRLQPSLRLGLAPAGLSLNARF